MGNRKSGDEPFHPAEFRLREFWQWSFSDLLSNGIRGVLAEFLVAKALGAAEGVRTEWDAVDIVTPSGVAVEVKSAAYIQSWYQSRNSKISFDIAKKRGWNAKSNECAVFAHRAAKVYVFALLTGRVREQVDPLKLEQWNFFVMATSRLEAAIGNQKSISLGRLMTFGPIVTDFSGLGVAIENESNI